MSQIIIKKDSTLKPLEIIIPLTNSSKGESGLDYTYNQQNVQQTLVYGIQSPLIRVNNIFVDFSDIVYFSLKSVGHMPTVNMTIRDRYKLISTIDTPGLDNELVILILPKFDKVYKKINLLFYISDIKVNNNSGFIQLTGIYKSPKMLSSNIKSFGEVSTYKLFEDIATDTKLGFASNIEENEEDKRYVYCDYKTYRDIMDREIASGGTKELVLDYWIDFWNNINLVDIRERYETIDLDEDMKIWIANRNQTVLEGEKITPIETVAVLNNHPSMESNELFVADYNIVNKSGSHVIGGTDKLYSTYENEKAEYVDYLVQDGDVKKDIYAKFEYMGEVYGKYNYLLSSRKRDVFFKKVNSETVEITLKTPLLGLMRGHKVNFLWYINNTLNKDKMDNLKEAKLTDESTASNISLESDVETKKNLLGEFKIDKSISGQYLIIGCNMMYEKNAWKYIITLARSNKDKPNILKEIEEENGGKL